LHQIGRLHPCLRFDQSGLYYQFDPFGRLNLCFRCCRYCLLRRFDRLDLWDRLDPWCRFGRLGLYYRFDPFGRLNQYYLGCRWFQWVRWDRWDRLGRQILAIPRDPWDPFDLECCHLINCVFLDSICLR
jgi:hypothetical protein